MTLTTPVSVNPAPADGPDMALLHELQALQDAVLRHRAALVAAERQLHQASAPMLARAMAMRRRHETLFAPVYAQSPAMADDYAEQFGRMPGPVFENPEWSIDGDNLEMHGRYDAGGGEFDFAVVRVPLRYLGADGEARMQADLATCQARPGGARVT